MKLSERMRQEIMRGTGEDYMIVREWATEVAQLEIELKQRPPKLPDHEIADSAQWWKEKCDLVHDELLDLRGERDALVRYARAKRAGDKEGALDAWIALDEPTRKEIEGE